MLPLRVARILGGSGQGYLQEGELPFPVGHKWVARLVTRTVSQILPITISATKWWSRCLWI